MANDARRRVLFTEQDRDYMVKFLSKYTSDPQGRSGNEIWKTLVENVRARICFRGLLKLTVYSIEKRQMELVPASLLAVMEKPLC